MITTWGPLGPIRTDTSEPAAAKTRILMPPVRSDGRYLAYREASVQHTPSRLTAEFISCELPAESGQRPSRPAPITFGVRLLTMPAP